MFGAAELGTTEYIITWLPLFAVGSCIDPSHTQQYMCAEPADDEQQESSAQTQRRLPRWIAVALRENTAQQSSKCPRIRDSTVGQQFSPGLHSVCVICCSSPFFL